jgi:charged multivesicular body protein 7
MLVVTAYFVDPKVICDAGRGESEYLGDSLYIQTGASPSSVMKIPLKEDDVKKTNWVKGKCVWGMGKSYLIYDLL